MKDLSTLYTDLTVYAAAHPDPTTRTAVEEVEALLRQSAAGGDKTPSAALVAGLKQAEQESLRVQSRIADILKDARVHQHVSTPDIVAAYEWLRDNPDRYEHVESPDPAFRTAMDGLPTDEGTRAALARLGWENYLAQPLPVFTYGTLRRGQHNEGWFGTGVEGRTERATVAGVAVYGPSWGFPYATEHDDEDAVVVGDLVALSNDSAGWTTRRDLDQLEGFYSGTPSQSHYRRVIRTITMPDGRKVKAWTYLAGSRAQGRLHEEDRVRDGDWVRAKDTYRDRRGRNVWPD